MWLVWFLGRPYYKQQKGKINLIAFSRNGAFWNGSRSSVFSVKDAEF